MSSLDNTIAVPLYEQLVSTLRERVDTQVFGFGEKIPSEAELCEKYEVSRITVRRAIDELVEEGYLERKQGKGTFVAQRRSPVTIMSFGDNVTEGFSSRYGGEKDRMKSIVVSKKEYTANKNERSLLNLVEGDSVLILTRLIVLDGKPWMIDRTVYPAKRFPGFFNVISDDVSTYKVMCETYCVRMARAHREITLAQATTEQGKLLGCRSSTPLFKIFKIVYDDQNQPVHLSTTYGQAQGTTLMVENGIRV